MKYVRIDRVWVFLDVVQDQFEASIAYWSAITGTEPSPRRGDRGQFLTLLPTTGRPVLKLQCLGEPDAGEGADRDRLHLDLDVADRDVALESLISHGARLRGAWKGVPALLTPAGQIFCVTMPGAGAAETAATEPPAATGRTAPPAPSRAAVPTTSPTVSPAVATAGDERVDSVVLKVAPEQFAAEVAFWSAATGAPPEAGPVADTIRLAGSGWPIGVVLIAGPTVEPPTSEPPTSEPPTVEPQAIRTAPRAEVPALVVIAVRDLAASTERHLGLGARLENQWGPWTVLVDPTGRHYALTAWS